MYSYKFVTEVVIVARILVVVQTVVLVISSLKNKLDFNL